MVGPRVYHIKHARSYPAFTAQDPAKVMDLATKWLNRHDFRIRRKNRNYSRGSKRGIHVNFVPKFKLFIEQGTNGQYVVRFDYYAKIKLGTAVVVGVLTSGISTVVGVGTLAVMLSDADHFVDKFWAHIDSLARGNPVILTVERWASDGKGNFVKQPAPTGPVAVAAMPGPQVNPSLVKRQSQSTPSQVVPAAHLPQPVHQTHPSQLPQQPQYGPGPHMPAHGQYGPPMSQSQHPSQLYYPPMPPPMPQQVAPPQIQPGQVYGHNALLQTQSLRASAPPPVPLAYPSSQASGHTNTSYNGAPQQHSAYPPYPPTNSPLQHAYPPHNSMPPQNNGHPPYNPYPIGSQHDHPAQRNLHSMPPALNNGHPPPPPMPNNHPTHSYAGHPAPLASQHSNVAPPTEQFARTSLHDQPTPLTSQNKPNLPAPISSQHTSNTNSNTLTTQHNRPASPTSSQRSYAPPPPFVAPSQGYPSPPSARNSHHAPAPQSTTAYPPPPTPHASTNYPPAPSMYGSGAVNDAATSQNPRPASQVGAQAAHFQDLANRQASTGDKPVYKGEQQAKNINRMSQYDLRSLPAGDNKSVVDQNTSSLYHDFNYADAQSSRKSAETFNPWDSNVLAATRKDTLTQDANASGLYPQIQRTPSGIAKH